MVSSLASCVGGRRFNSQVRQPKRSALRAFMKCIESEFKQLSDRCNQMFHDVSKNVAKLETDIANFVSQPLSGTSDSPASETHSMLLQKISDQLEVISLNQANASTARPPNFPTPPIHFSHATTMSSPTTAQHHQNCTEGLLPNFIDENTTNSLMDFLQKSEFKSENGRSTLSFGEPYTYTGSKSSRDTATHSLLYFNQLLIRSTNFRKICSMPTILT